MNNMLDLPTGYQEILKIDMKTNKKLMLRISLISLLFAVIMVVCASFFVPLSHLLEKTDTLNSLIKKFVVLIVLMVVYTVLHELVHGIFMKIFSGTKVKYGFKGLYAYAGSSAYFNKTSYIIIALAPVVILGVVLIVLNCIVPISWFWVVYFLQVTNITGASGDIYVTYKMAQMPSDILVNDIGDAMTVYGRS